MKRRFIPILVTFLIGVVTFSGLGLINTATAINQDPYPGLCTPIPDSLNPEYVQCSDVMVEMRDGTKLATNIYLPITEEEAVPALVIRTPYRKGGLEGWQSTTFYAKNGYAVVAQDTRGRYGSEGVFDFVFDDANDGYDTIEWVASQEGWCNGKVGTYGHSYNAYTQYLLPLATDPVSGKPSSPPHLVCMLPLQGTSNLVEESMFTGGAYQLDRYLSWGLGQSIDTARRKDIDEGTSPFYENMMIQARYTDYNSKWLDYLPRNDIEPLNIVTVWWEESLNHPADDWYWKQVAPNQAHKIWPVPTYHVGGWYDILLDGTTNNYIGINKHGPKKRYVEALDERVNIRKTQKLMVGPWTHSRPTNNVGPFVYPGADLTGAGIGCTDPTSGVCWDNERLRWFDYWLKGIDNGIMDEPPVLIYVMEGENEGYWRSENEWPLARTQYKKYYLREGAPEPIDSLNDGILSTHKPKKKEDPDSFDYDPANPTPTVGGNISGTAPAGVRGPMDQQLIEGDVLTYTTDPLKKDTEVTGPITAHLWVSSSAPDTDFTAKLADVYPDGRSIIIQDSILRARYHKSREKEKLLKPGKIYKLTIYLGPTSTVFKAGHRIRVDVASSNYPRFDNNPNTGKKFGTDVEDDFVIATNTIYHDKKHPSHILLPIIP